MKDSEDTVDKQLKSYIRNHSGGNYREKEESKVVRDKAFAKEAEKKASRLQVDESDVAAEKYLEVMHQVKKAKGNAKTHKKRFRALSHRDDFQ